MNFSRVHAQPKRKSESFLRREFSMEIRSAILTAEAAVRLLEGINLRLSQWAILQLAIEDKFGGPGTRQKSEELANDILSWLTTSKESDVYDLEARIENFIYDSLETLMDDDTMESEPLEIMKMYEECLQGNYNSVAELRKANSPTNVAAQFQQVFNDEDDDGDEISTDNDSSEMMVDFPGAQPHDIEKNMMINELTAEDEDGWTTVGPRRNRGRRN